MSSHSTRDVRTAACSPSSAPPPPPSYIGVNVVVDAREDERRRRVLLHAAIDGNLDLLSRMAVELDAAERGGTGAAGVWSTCGRGALHLAAANGRAHVCRYLIQDLGFPVDAPSSSGETPLLLAATFGHTETAAHLLERGASPCAPDTDGETPLHWAAYNGDRELAMLLLHRGADAGAANPRGTPLHVAAERAHPDVVSVLLRQGADPNKVANGVFTPLVSSLVGGSLKWMKLLILAGANVNAGGFSGATPLFIACSRRGTAPFVKCLLAAGADPNALDELGRLPIEIAAVHAETEVVELLFPVTRRAPKVPDWTVGGIVSYVNSAAYKKWVCHIFILLKDELKQQGYSAFQRKDYDEAILLYSMALKIDDTDAVLYSNRSVCWLHLGVGDEALSDAQACTRLRPDLAEGYYHQRMAFNLLQRFGCPSKDLEPGSGEHRHQRRSTVLSHSTCSLA
ncbi:ankyrin-1-like [Lolium rigidum]|uniref:ankyrin-1-like n=1 Tax=Lolium rigidum TaxID=89674 RepID=UPI001F5CCAAB|nr:ankyrin-1-like [Lolium rigidum]